jgi:hypothetical protein
MFGLWGIVDEKCLKHHPLSFSILPAQATSILQRKIKIYKGKNGEMSFSISPP